MKMILVLCLIGWLTLVSTNDLLVFPGLNANQSCEIDNQPKSGKCVPYKQCEGESKQLCDLYEDVVYVCCANSFVNEGSVELRNSRHDETG